MALSIEKQIAETINGRKQLLIITNKEFDGDKLSAALAWFLFLKKRFGNDKKVDICIENFSKPFKFSFLPGVEEINSSMNNFKNFVISVNVDNVKVNDISYDLKDNELKFIINSNGIFDNKDVTFRTGDFKYDLIFSIGVPDLETLGNFYDNDPEFFYKVPVINIDHSPKNEQFGQINHIDLTATSNSEIIFDLIEKVDLKALDHDISTCLLAGIMDKTKSFKTKNVTPKVLNIASTLMAENARKEEIIANLFRTKTITSLKLWGKALARLKMDQDHKIVWTLITKQDFIHTNTQDIDLRDVIEEFIASIPDAKIISVFYENESDRVAGLVHVTNSVDARELIKEFSPEGSKNFVKFGLSGKNLLEAEKEVIEAIRGKLISQAVVS